MSVYTEDLFVPIEKQIALVKFERDFTLMGRPFQALVRNVVVGETMEQGGEAEAAFIERALRHLAFYSSTAKIQTCCGCVQYRDPCRQSEMEIAVPLYWPTSLAPVDTETEFSQIRSGYRIFRRTNRPDERGLRVFSEVRT